MNQASARFEQYLNRRFPHSTTPKHYRSDLHIFITLIGDKPPTEVKAEDIDRFVEQQMTAELKPTTINRRLATLHTFFEYLASEQPERAWPNPVIGRRHYLRTGFHLPRDLVDEVVERLFAVMTDVRDRAMFGLMVGAGLRVGEVAALHLGDVEPPTQPDQLVKVRVYGKGQKERVVWLTHSLWAVVLAWRQVRPAVQDDHLFLSHSGCPISVAGIQYRLHQHAHAAGVSVSCHRLRHTFARRLVEHGLAVDSLAKLLGHQQLATTQHYIDGADPTVRTDFTKAMAQLETTFSRHQPVSPVPSPPLPPSPPRTGSPAALGKLRQQLATLPPWFAEALDAYLCWRWPTWNAQTAAQNGRNLLSLARRFWTWLATHRQIAGWASLRRPDFEAWLGARQQDAVSPVTVSNDLGQLRCWFRFLERRDYPLDPGLFRVQTPKPPTEALPRFLSEVAYTQLEHTISNAMQPDDEQSKLDYAWFLLLAHTGVRLSESLDLRLADLHLTLGYATIRGGKPGRDRVVYLTPRLIAALHGYLKLRTAPAAEDHVFLLHGHSPTARTLQRRLAEYGEQAGVMAVTPHRLRHTFATRLLNQGMPIHSLKKLLGHQHLETTQIYARLYDDVLYAQFKAAMAQIEGIAVEAWPGVMTATTKQVAPIVAVLT